MKTNKKILLINFGGIGDEILFLPTVDTVRKANPSATIFLAVEPRSKSIMELTQAVDDIIEIDIKSKHKYVNIFKLLCFAWLEKFDIVISSGANKSIPILLKLMGAKQSYGYNSGFLAAKLLTNPVDLNTKQYAGKMYHDLVASMGTNTDFIPKITLEEIQKIPNSILIHPGVSKMSVQKNIIKIFGAEIWTEIIERLLQNGKTVLLAGGPDDDEVIKKIVESLKNKNLLKSQNFINLYGKTRSIKDLARRIKEAEILLCSDSAPMHIGVGVGTKTFAIFGPTDENKLLPQNENFVPLSVNCECRPCLWDKRQTSCENQKCLQFIPEQIVAKIIQ